MAYDKDRIDDELEYSEAADDEENIDENEDILENDTDENLDGGNLKTGIVIAVIIAVIVAMVALFVVFSVINKPSSSGAEVSIATQDSSDDTTEVAVSETTELMTEKESETNAETKPSDNESTSEKKDEKHRYVPGFLDNDNYEEEIAVIKEYYECLNNLDFEGIKKLLYEGDEEFIPAEFDETKIKDTMELVKQYKNVECFLIKGVQADTFVVYATYDIKFYGIDTLAPSLSRLFVMKDSNGNIKIHSGEMPSRVYSHIVATSTNNNVKQLIEVIDRELYTAKQNDERLAELMSIIG